MFSLQGDGVEVTHKVPTDNIDQSEEPSRHSPSELNYQSVYNDLNDQEKEDRQDVPIEVNKEGSQIKNDQADFNNSSFVCSSSRFPFTFDLKYSFASMSDVDLITLYMHFWKKLNEGMLEGQRKTIQKEKGCLTIMISFWNCHCPKQELFYKLAYKYQLLDDSVQQHAFDSEFTRIRYVALLWNYGMQKIQADATIDSEAPERPIRIHRDCDSSERITIN
ncbi:hypothetical protein MTR67_014022 [Solanum verrucosum]|uniref:Uncharacterized protein n=1 Tax=Solanum verrucosum TaxID=315347 RepID=A0AAF0QBH0_SOLVR|nr:hypothetical protein MTR67_014022 [Solanum verrucosum]